MPFLVRFLVRHAAIGVGVAAVFVALLVAFDVARLGTLFASASDGPLAVGVLTFALGLTFGSVQMGFAVMLMSDKDEPPSGRLVRLTRLVPRFAKVTARRSRAFPRFIESGKRSRLLSLRVFFTRTGIHFARKRSNL